MKLGKRKRNNNDYKKILRINDGIILFICEIEIKSNYNIVKLTVNVFMFLILMIILYYIEVYYKNNNWKMVIIRVK